MSRCVIFGSCEIKNYSSIKVDKSDYIIAADGGLFYLDKMGLVADIVLGDFDSLHCELNNYKSKITVPCEKDDTDMMLAVKTALEKGCNQIVIYGGIGGRLDHTVANIQTLEFVDDKGAEAVLVGDNDIVMFQSCGIKEYPFKENHYFSVFAYSETADISLQGTKYFLNNYNLKRNFPLGVSNEITEKSCKLQVNSGKILVIYSKK